MGLTMKVTKEVDVPGLGARIRRERERYQKAKDPRPSVSAVAASAKMTSANWYRIESEETKVLPFKTLRAIESVLGVSFEVSFND